MNFLRKHWFDLGGTIGILLLILLFFTGRGFSPYQLLMWLSLVSLFFHQLEEYRFPGTFPGMLNKVLYNSDLPDRYPLNTQTAVYVNVFVGWVVYFLAAFFAEKAIWLGMGAIVVSLGNIIGHTTLFNIKGKTWYNPGLLTSWLFFAPLTYFFFRIIHTENLVTPKDYLIGVPLGVVLNVIGIVKLIDWMKDRNTPYIFPKRSLLPADRKPLFSEPSQNYV